MSKPQRIQLKRTKGWRMPPNTIKVDRTNPMFGNPFKSGGEHNLTKAEAVECYRIWLKEKPLGQTVAYAARHANGPGGIRGKNLACWCAPGEPCHADVLLEIANS